MVIVGEALGGYTVVYNVVDGLEVEALLNLCIGTRQHMGGDEDGEQAVERLEQLERFERFERSECHGGMWLVDTFRSTE